MCSVYSYHYLIFNIHHVSGCLHVTVPGVFLKIYEIIGYFLSIFVLKDVSGLFFTCNLENLLLSILIPLGMFSLMGHLVVKDWVGKGLGMDSHGCGRGC